jgi:hypothetical protein
MNSKQSELNHFFSFVREGMTQDEIKSLLTRVYDSQQVVIDELILEYCPGEMSEDQWTEYEKSQRLVTHQLDIL